MVRTKLCNRCGESYMATARNNGKLVLTVGNPEVEADLCEQCFEEMVEAYRERPS